MLRTNTEVLNSWTFLSLLIEPYKDVLKMSLRRLWGCPQDVGRARPLTIWRCPHNVYRRGPQDVRRFRPLALRIGQYGDVLKMSYFNALRTSVVDAPWCSIEDQMGSSIRHGDVLRTVSGRYFAEWVVSLIAV